MQCDPQIASRFEQMELPVYAESEELRRFIAGYLLLLPILKMPKAVDKRFIEYLQELIDDATGRIIAVLRRAASHTLALRSKTMASKTTIRRFPTVHNYQPTDVISSLGSVK